MMTSPTRTAVEAANEFLDWAQDDGRDLATKVALALDAFADQTRQEEREAIAALLPDDGDGCGPNDFARAAIERARREEQDRCVKVADDVREEARQLGNPGMALGAAEARDRIRITARVRAITRQRP